MCGSEVERKKIQQEFNSTMLILLVCICYLLPTVWQRQMMCGSEVERKKIQQEFNSTALILLVCICYLLPTVWQRQMMCGSDVERKKNTTRVQFDNTDIISVHMLLTYYSVAETDDVW